MKKIVVLFMCICMCGVLFAQGAQEAEVETAEPLKLIFCDSTVPTEPAVQAAYLFIDELKKVSNGQMDIDYYHSGSLFSQNDQTLAAMDGSVDMSVTSFAWLTEFVPEIGTLASAFNFRDAEHIHKFLNDSAVGKEIYEKIAKQLNIRILGGFFFGYRQISVVDKVGPVYSPADLKGVKLRMPSTPIWLAVGRALGANPTPLASTEAYMGLKTGTVDGVDMPLNQMKSLKLYETIKYVTLTNHIVEQQLVIINEDRWQSLTDEQRGWIEQSIDKMTKYATDAYVSVFDEDVQFLKDQGIEFIENPDMEAFREYSRNSFLTKDSNLSSKWDWDLFDRIQQVK